MVFFNKLKKGKFLKSVLLLSSGTAMAQLLHVLATPIITRVYTPEEYGVLTVFITIVSVLSLSGFKYELAIPIAKNEKHAINVLGLSATILTIYVLLLLNFLLLFGNSLSEIVDFSEIDYYQYFIPLGVLLLGLYQILRQWGLREKEFKSISKTIINQSVYGNITKISFGLFGMGSLGLVVGQLIKDSAGIFTLSKPLLKKGRKLFKKIKISNMLWCIKRYKDFPLYNLPSHVLSNISIHLPMLFLTFIYGTKVVGLFGLAHTIVRIPMRLVGAAVGDVFYSEAASMGRQNPERLKELSNNLITKLIIIGSLPLIILLILGPQLFSLVFGESWYQAGVYARIISIMLFFILIFAPVSRVYEVFEMQKIRFYIEIFKVLLVILVFLISLFFKLNSYMTVFLYSIAMSIVHLIIFLVAQKILNKAIYNKLKSD